MNYQLCMEKIIEGLGTEKPRLLLHVCCAPCFSYPLELLHPHFDITAYYYNPNIMPLAEYEKRLGEFEKLRHLPFALRVEEWDNPRYLDCVRGMEGEPEGGSRCAACIGLRLEKTAELAAAEGFDFFATTLTVSPHKNAPLINRMGEELAARFGVKWLPSDFKKKEGYKRSIVLCRELDIYRQDYCGCRLEPAAE